MKRILAVLLGMILGLVPIAATAAPGDATLLRRDMDGFNESIQSMAYLDGITYWLTYNGIYTCKDGDTQVKKQEEGLPSIEDEEGGSRYLEPMALFEAEGQMRLLMAESASYEEDEDWYTEVEGARLYRVAIEGDVLSFEELDTLDWDEMVEDVDEGYEHALRMQKPFSMDGRLYFTAYRNSANAIMGYDLEEQELILEEEIPGLESAYRYRDGLLLLVNVDFENAECPIRLESYDPETGESELLCEMASSGYDAPGHVLYDPETDTLYYVMGGELWAMRGMDPESAKSIGAVLIDNWSECAPVLTDDKCLVLCDHQTALRRNTDPQTRAEHRLVVQNGYRETVQNACFSFGNRRGDVEIVLANINEDILQMMMNRSSEVDIFCLEVSTPTFEAMYQRGYLAPLDEREAIAQFVQSTAPAYQQVLLREGEIVAVPLFPDASCITLNKAALEKLGISEQELPACWEEFFDFLEALPPMLEEHPEMKAVIPFTTQQEFRWTLFNTLLASYLYRQANGEEGVSLDTELFRRLVGRLENLDLEALGIAEEQTLNSFAYEDGDLLMQLNASLSESLYTWNSEKPLPLALEAGEEPILLGQLTVLVVNPYSENREIALEFLEEVIGLLDEITRIQVCPEYNEPVEAAYFASNLEYYDESIAGVEEQIENASEEEREDLERTLQDLRRNREEMIERDRWEISPESIQAYRRDAQYLVVSRYLGMDEGEFYTLINQYLADEISIDTFIQEVDGKWRMMMLENS